MDSSTHNTIFNVGAFIGAIIIGGIAIANVIYFNRLRETQNNGITHNEAVTMLWLNVVVIAIAVIAFLWSIIRTISGTRKRYKSIF